jgi:hypothetical protein
LALSVASREAKRTPFLDLGRMPIDMTLPAFVTAVRSTSTQVAGDAFTRDAAMAPESTGRLFQLRFDSVQRASEISSKSAALVEPLVT